MLKKSDDPTMQGEFDLDIPAEKWDKFGLIQIWTES